MAFDPGQGGGGGGPSPNLFQNNPNWGTLRDQYPDEPGKGGGGLAGGNYASYKTGGFGQLPGGAGPLAEALTANRPAIGSSGAAEIPRDVTNQVGAGNAAAVARAGRSEAFETEMQTQQTQFGRLRLQALQKLLGLFGGAGAVGGGGMGGGSLDFNSILTGMRRESALPFEQERRALQSRIAAGGRQFSSASQNQLNMLNERQGLAGETAYSRAADVWSRQGLTPRFLAEMLQQETR